MEDDYSYHGVNRMLPFWITPQNKIAVMREVKHACPYVSEQTTIHELDDEELLRLCGVFYAQVKDHGWCICIPVSKASAAAPAPSITISRFFQLTGICTYSVDRGSDRA